MRKRILLALISTALVLAGARFMYVATVCEVGWAVVADQWQDAFWFFGIERKPIGEELPSKQADYWLRRVDRIVAIDPQSASLCMGAAWVLDSYDSAFIGDLDIGSDWELISSEATQFEKKCRVKSRELARRAAELDPTDVRWWRMRAIADGVLPWLSGDDETPARDATWLKMLDECKLHDPDNGLYDYLAAVYLWETSASYGWNFVGDEELEYDEDEDDDYYVLTINECQRFQLGVTRFNEAQQKPYVAIGEEGFSAIADFASRSGFRKPDQAALATSRQVTWRHAILGSNICRWQQARQDDARLAMEPERELRLLLEQLRLHEQLIAPSETTSLDWALKFDSFRNTTIEKIEQLAAAHPEVIEDSQLDSIRQRDEEMRIDSATLSEAVKNLEASRKPSNRLVDWPAIFAGTAALYTAPLLAIGVLLALALRWCPQPNSDSPQLGIVQNTLIWLVACGATFAALGMAPAGIISEQMQRTIEIAIFCLFGMLFVGAFIYYGFRALRHRRFRFDIKSLFATMLVVALAGWAWPLIADVFEAMLDRTREFRVPPREWFGMDAFLFRRALGVEDASWQWATLQWYAYYGYYVQVAVALSLLVVWFVVRCCFRFKQDMFRFSHWVSLAESGRRSAIGAALVGLFLYLALAPSTIRYAEADYHYKMRYCRDLKAHYDEIRAAQAEIENDRTQLELIREQVQFELSSDELLEQDFAAE